MRPSVLLVLAMVLPIAAAASSCTAGICQGSYDYKGGPGDCYGSTATYAEARQDSVSYDDGTTRVIATGGERCYARGVPLASSGHTLEVGVGASHAGTGMASTFTWSNDRTSNADACHMTLAAFHPLGASAVTLPCIVDAPWIYRPSPFLP